jgi:hypothetical protein
VVESASIPTAPGAPIHRPEHELHRSARALFSNGFAPLWQALAPFLRHDVSVCTLLQLFYGDKFKTEQILKFTNLKILNIFKI